jgi:hypothetical protein
MFEGKNDNGQDVQLKFAQILAQRTHYQLLTSTLVARACGMIGRDELVRPMLYAARLVRSENGSKRTSLPSAALLLDQESHFVGAHSLDFRLPLATSDERNTDN